MKSIVNGVHIGKADVRLFIEASIDGEVVHSQEADSLVAAFLHPVYGLMGGTDAPTGMTHYFEPYNTDIEGTFYRDYQPVASVVVTAGQNVQVNLGSTGYLSIDRARTNAQSRLLVCGFEGDLAYLNGIHPVGPRIDAQGNYGTTLLGVVGTGGSATITPGSTPRVRPLLYTGVPRPTTGYTGMSLCLGKSSRAVAVTDTVLFEEIPTGEGGPNVLQRGGLSVSPIAYDPNGLEAELTFSRDFTNNGTNLVEIREVGLYGNIATSYLGSNYSGQYYRLMARDLVDIDLAVGKTVTVSYRIKTAVTESGGFVKQFIQMLRRRMAGGGENVRNVDGTYVNTTGHTADDFLLTSASGANRPHTDTYRFEGNMYGLQLGTGDAVPTAGDYKLQTRIENGRGAGQVVYYGCLVDNYRIEGNQAKFDIVRIAENLSNAPVTVSEVGLYVAQTSINGYTTSPYLAMVTRNVLDAPVTIEPGESVKVVYTISLLAGA